MISALFAPALKYIAGGLLFVCIVLGIGLHLERVHSAKLSLRIAELNQLRAADRASYEAAQKAAEAKNLADNARTEQTYRRNTDEISSRYQRELADLRLRAQSRAHQGSAGPTSPPGVSGSAKGSDGTDQLLLPPGGLLRAQEIELQLMELQDWVTKQSQVDPNR